jgi:SNF2 family DNA or RNA helicase
MASTTVHSEALVSAKFKVFMVPYHEGLRNLVPNSKHFYHPTKGQQLIVPHEIDTVKLARNFGFRVPAPILSRYDWNNHTGKDAPFKTQKITAAMLTMNRRAYVLSQMGTGKTRATLHALNYLMLTGEIKRAVVVAPLSTLWNVWDSEVFRYFNHLSVSVLYGSKDKRIKLLNDPADIYVINHQGVGVLINELKARGDLDAIVIDELGILRTEGTNMWCDINALIQNRKYVWGLTGSPTPNEPADAWAQCKLLTPHSVPSRFMHFKRITMRKVSQFRWVPKDDANDIVYEAMQPAVRFKRSDCTELPPVVYQSRKVALSKQQERVYKTMIEKLTVMFQQGQVTAANEGVLFSKLLQIAAGWVYTTDKQIVGLDNTDRLENLLEIIDESDGKVIVFNEFVHAAMNLYSVLEKKRIACSLVTGQTPASDRNQIFTAFQNHQYPRVLVAHPKCMAHGLTLTAANTIVWFTPTTSLETYEQACARITRPGQKLNQLIIHLTGTPVEAKLYRRLQQKKTTQGALLELFEGKETDE